MLDWGLTSELLSLPVSPTQSAVNSGKGATGQKTSANNKSTTGGAQSGLSRPAPAGGSAPSSCTIGYICFDPASALPRLRKVIIQGGVSNVCGSVPASADYKFPFGAVSAEITLVFRSTESIYKYLGKLLREQMGNRINFIYSDANFLSEEPFFNVIKGSGGNGDCFVSAYYDGQSYCVPRVKANNTAMIFDILQQLRNRNISPTDLNAPLSVRVVD
jgi:hypothetical protein